MGARQNCTHFYRSRTPVRSSLCKHNVPASGSHTEHVLSWGMMQFCLRARCSFFHFFSPFMWAKKWFFSKVAKIGLAFSGRRPLVFFSKCGSSKSAFSRDGGTMRHEEIAVEHGEKLSRSGGTVLPQVKSDFCFQWGVGHNFAQRRIALFAYSGEKGCWNVNEK